MNSQRFAALGVTISMAYPRRYWWPAAHKRCGAAAVKVAPRRSPFYVPHQLARCINLGPDSHLPRVLAPQIDLHGAAEAAEEAGCRSRK